MVISTVHVLSIYFILYKCVQSIFKSICMLDKYLLKYLQSPPPLTQATLVTFLSDMHFITHLFICSNLYKKLDKLIVICNAIKHISKSLIPVYVISIEVSAPLLQRRQCVRGCILFLMYTKYP